ncbi:hypothetical protein AB1Y20_021464 [Prymnesium parvum]|uniref:Oxidoreductase FAD/NAD(P)-binding domain-containing protein n=1 Tax=Prymnesium parvum TaxID=97485 RepID=A0AB34JIQ9_PRYPA
MSASSRRHSSLSAVSHAVSLSVHRRLASLRVVPEEEVQTLEPSSSDFFEVGGHAALPARKVLDALNERCRHRGVADAELDGALSSHGGFLPLAWAEEVLEFGWVNLHDEIKERVQVGTRVTHDVHGNGHVVGFGQKREILVEFESEKKSLHSYTVHTMEHLKFPGAIFKTECAGLVTPHVGGGHARLPESHASWEEAASAMPSAYREGSFGKLVSSLPPLSFAAADLPSKYLPRAAALLALLCHGCHYFGGMDLPPPHVMEAWREVTRRLDRPMPMMHINDLVLHNWQLNEEGRACAQPALVAALALDQRPEVAALVSAKELHAEASDDNAPPRTVWSEAGLGSFDAVDRLKVLIPVFGGREGGCLTEDVFLCTITVMHMVTAPLVELCVACQEAAMRDQPERVAQLLTHIKACIDAATRAFLRIDPMSSSSTYCDQIEWARTVGTIPVPILPDAQAASGLEMPLFHLCDVFLGRALFHSVYGKQMLEERAKNLPRNHRDFLAAIEKISVRAYISSKASASLAARWNATVESFAGERGLLGVHALKASGYLEVAVKVGRVQMNATTCNESDWRARQWLTPIEHLHESRNERYTGKISADQGQKGSFAKAEIVAVGDAAATAMSPEERQPRGCPFSSSRAGSGSWRCPFAYTRRNAQAVGQDRAGHLKMSGKSQATLEAAMLSSARRLLLVPDDLWKKHAEELSIPLENGCFLCLYVMLQNAQITALPYSVLETFAAECPHVKAGTSLHRRILNSGKVSASLADLFDIAFEPPYHTLRDGGAWLLYGPVCDVLKPLAARNYSIASAPDGIWPSQLELCIGRQQWLVEMPPRLQKLHLPHRTVSRLRSSRFVEESSKFNYKQTPISRDLSQLSSKQIKRVGVLTHSLLDTPFPHNGRKPVMLRIEPSLRFHLPTDPSVPLLLFAAGTGVAPFRGFLSARLSLEHAGKITLFYSLRDVAAAPFIRELEDLANSSAGRFKLHLCVSQSRLPSVVPANVMVHPGHVDGVIQAEEEQIWRALSGDSSSSAAEQPGNESEQNTVSAF